MTPMWNYMSRTVVALALACAGYILVYRPLQLRWGATQEEVQRAMPGDEVQSKPVFNATRALTIRAKAEQAWPWIVQIGYRRAGWYGYDWIDNDGIRSAEQILPEWQHVNVGETVPIWRGVNFRVTAIEPDKYFVFASESGADSMAIGLYPLNENHTRLVWRIRLGPYNWKSRWIAAQLFTDAADFIAVRQSLLGIKARAEGDAPESARRMHGELGLWLLSFLVFVLAEIGLIASGELWLTLLVAASTGFLTVWLVLAKPPLWMDLLGPLAAAALVWRVFRSPKIREKAKGAAG
jgi:hypothetical protein